MSNMGELRCRRIYEPAAPEDGWRVLVDRLWPRGISRERAALDRWEKDAAPSPRLREWLGHAPERFAVFADAYRAELGDNPLAAAFVQACAEHLQRGNVTLLYAARDEACNHARVLRDWLEEGIAASGSKTGKEQTDGF